MILILLCFFPLVCFVILTSKIQERINFEHFILDRYSDKDSKYKMTSIFKLPEITAFPKLIHLENHYKLFIVGIVQLLVNNIEKILAANNKPLTTN